MTFFPKSITFAHNFNLAIALIHETKAIVFLLSIYLLAGYFCAVQARIHAVPL